MIHEGYKFVIGNKLENKAEVTQPLPQALILIQNGEDEGVRLAIILLRSYTRYKDKKTNKSKKKQLKKLQDQMPVDDTDQAGKVEDDSEEEMVDNKEEAKQMTVGKTKLIFKEKEKKTREYIKALMKKRQQLNKKDLRCRDERKDITKEIKTLREQLDKEKQEHLSQFEKQDNNPSVD